MPRVGSRQTPSYTALQQQCVWTMSVSYQCERCHTIYHTSTTAVLCTCIYIHNRHRHVPRTINNKDDTRFAAPCIMYCTYTYERTHHAVVRNAEVLLLLCDIMSLSARPKSVRESTKKSCIRACLWYIHDKALLIICQRGYNVLMTRVL